MQYPCMFNWYLALEKCLACSCFHRNRRKEVNSDHKSYFISTFQRRYRGVDALILTSKLYLVRKEASICFSYYTKLNAVKKECLHRYIHYLNRPIGWKEKFKIRKNASTSPGLPYNGTMEIIYLGFLF